MTWGRPEQHQRAFDEGWEIFDASGSDANRDGTWPYQIQALTEEGILDDDHVAHRLVVDGAKAGQDHHLAALRFLRDHSKPELEMVYRGTHWLQCLDVDDNHLDAAETDIFGRVITR